MCKSACERIRAALDDVCTERNLEFFFGPLVYLIFIPTNVNDRELTEEGPRALREDRN